MKSIIHHDQVGFIKAMREWINICKSTKNVTHHINKPKDKNHMIILIDSENNTDNIQYPFIIKTFNKVGLERKYISIIKFIYVKPIANILLSVENCKLFLYNQTKRQQCPLSPFLINIHSIKLPSHNNPTWKR